MTNEQINELEGFVIRIYDLSDKSQLARLDPNYATNDNNEKFSSLVALYLIL